MTSSSLLVDKDKDTTEAICECSKKLTRDSQYMLIGYAMAVANMEERYAKKRKSSD